ncbi:hypothetical protein HDC32_000124 [Pseudomonas sp. JAI120]|nr:hypothetical protein [Pseudomonas sp. SJZ073]MBB6310455.1 hypothetical protein [Pseudomonas sp. JAI120]
MGYGIKFTNNSNTVTLDSEFSRLVVLEKGSWNGTGSGVSVQFAKPVTTAEPPLIFVRPGLSTTLCFCTVQGSSGYWTGFSFRGIVGQATYGNWFIGAFKAEPTATYGFRLWDAAGKLLFDSGTPCAQFTRSISRWSYLGSSSDPQGQTVLRWTAQSPLSGGDYMLLNNVAMDIAGGTSRQGNLYAIWEYQNDRLVMRAVGVDLRIAFFVTIVFAKPVS